MSRAMKAALMSAFVFPGTGHMMLKHYFRGGLCAVLTLAGLGVIASVYIQIAQQLAGQIASGELALDVAAITQQLSAMSGGSVSTAYGWAIALVLGCWVFGVVDAFRLGSLESR